MGVDAGPARRLGLLALLIAAALFAVPPAWGQPAPAPAKPSASSAAKPPAATAGKPSASASASPSASAAASASPSASAAGSATPAAAGSTTPSAAAAASGAPSADAPEIDPSVRTAAHIRSLVAGDLDVTLSPDTLFDAPLSDEPALQLAAARLRALLRSTEAPPPDATPTATPTASASARHAASKDAGAPTATATPTGADPGTPPGPTPPAGLDAAAWEARLALDRERLAFYDLPRPRRDEILARHTARQAAAAKGLPAPPGETPDEARARQAEEERRKALAAAAQARTEAERLVSEELARLLGIERAHADLAQRFAADRKALADRRDVLLGWQRRAREAREAGSAAQVDATYEAIHVALGAARADLQASLAAVASSPSAVADVGPDPLQQLPPDIDTQAPRAKRRDLSESARRLRDAERALHVESATVLHDEMDALNRERLGLLPLLSPERRAAVTGLTSAGWDEAGGELRHVLLVFRYHRLATTEWAAALRSSGGAVSGTVARAAAVIVPWVLAIALFSWWRRRVPRLLALMEKRIEEADHAARLPGVSLGLRAVRFARDVRRPLEWFLLLAALAWLLPQSAHALLEVQLVTLAALWALGGALAVAAVNAAIAPRGGLSAAEGDATGDLRLRSLRLIGRVAVGFILVLTLSSRLVGEGTIYGWVLSMVWVAVLPVFLVLVRWWRDTVFERIERSRKKSRFQEWALGNRTGYKSFFAATSAAVHLFVTSAIKAARQWIGAFYLARRVGAYLFRRELTKLEQAAAGDLPPLGGEAFDKLGPDSPSPGWTGAAATEVASRICREIEAPRGRVLALVGEWGAGKTAILERVRARCPGAVRVDCLEAGGLDGLALRLGETCSAPDGATLVDVGRLLDGEGARKASGDRPRAVLLDDVQRFVRPVMGGLADFDRLVAVARAHSERATWVLAIDAAVWPFLRLARGAHPLFDDVITLAPWPEEDIAALLTARNAGANIDPTFEDLIEQLPRGADEIDRLEAIAERKAGYVRLLWDSARGNPAMALEMWRRSLGVDEAGRVRVRPLVTPDTAPLEGLPDTVLFVLRAVMQMGPATASGVEEATKLPATEIADALRYGVAHGHLVQRRAGVAVSRTWFAAVCRVLERRHLLVSP